MVIIIFIVGILIGMLIAVIEFRKLIAGTLRVDQSDPDDQPYLFLEISQEPNRAFNKKHIILKVNIQNYISHK